MKSLLWAAAFAAAASPALAASEEIVILGRGPQAAAAVRLDAERLEAAAVRSLDDLAVAVPGLFLMNDQDPGTNILSLRGVTTDRLQQAAVAFVVDEVALADTDLFTLPLHDLSGVEVVRGPQGARFGRNAAGGVVALQSAQGPGGRVRLEVGDGGLRRTEVARGWGDAEEGVRLSGLWSAADGWIENRTLGKTVDAHDVRAARAIANARLAAARLSAKIEGYAEDGGAAWASSGDVTGDFGGHLDGAALTDPIGDYEGRARRQWLQASLRLTAPLWGGELRALAAADDYVKRWREELDYRPGPITFFGAAIFPDGLQPIAQPTDVAAVTAQVRWTRTAGAWTLGLGAFRQDTDRRRLDDFGPLLFGAPAPLYETRSAQSAVFGSLAWAAGPASLESQLRFDAERRTQTISASGVTLDRRTLSDERLQPRIAASYALGREFRLYTAYGEAYRAGGFNPRPKAGSVWRPAFAPEIARSLEAGVRWRGGVARAEANAFTTRLDAYQSYAFLDGNSVTLSVDEARIDGVELSGEARMSLGGGWTGEAGGAFALARGEVVRYVAPDPLIAGARRDYSGNRLPNAPEWTGAVTAEAARGPFSLRLTINGAGETFYEIDNALVSPPRAWGDVRLAFARGDWTVAVWGKNVTDERWAISAFGQGMLPLLAGLGPGGPYDTFTINRGRQLGVTLTREFAP